MYDIIGDIHGYDIKLEFLLKKLGYKKKNGVYGHKSKKAIFLGDFVDRGPNSKGVIDIVRPMIENETAMAVLGNHEFNLISFFTKDSEQRFYRAHDLNNIVQISETVKSYQKHETLFYETIEWLKTLPLFLQLPEFNLVHACWHQESIAFLQSRYQGKLSNELLKDYYTEKGSIKKALDIVIKGPEVALPENVFYYDNDGFERHKTRIKWWKKTIGKSVAEVSTKKISIDKSIKVPFDFDLEINYENLKKPVFIGHYCLENKLQLTSKKVICVDFCVVKTGRLSAYTYANKAILVKNFTVVV